MVVDQALIAKITAEIVASLQGGEGNAKQVQDGIFDTVDEAVAAARKAYKELKQFSRMEREKFVQAIRDAAYANAATMAVFIIFLDMIALLFRVHYLGLRVAQKHSIDSKLIVDYSCSLRQRLNRFLLTH